jgi:hypothetical protein
VGACARAGEFHHRRSAFRISKLRLLRRSKISHPEVQDFVLRNAIRKSLIFLMNNLTLL